MLYIVAVWTILTTVCLLLGFTILNFFESNYFKFRDKIILSVWVGIIGFTILFLALSFIVPLSTTTGIIVYLIVTLLALFFLKKKKTLKLLTNYFRVKYIRLYCLIVFLVAILIAKNNISWSDTGLYHWQAIKWLSNFGTVTGISLIHSRLGYNAGWFAFSAPLNVPQLGSHIGAISNGFILLIAIFHLVIAIKYLLNKNGYIADWFIAIYHSVLLVNYTFVPSARKLLLSYSPDVAVNFFIGIVAWVILSICNSSRNSEPIFNRSFIPLLLAIGTVTMKLTALPLLLISFAFLVFNSSQKIKAFTVGTILSILLLTPMFVYSIKTTGCLLYPWLPDTS